MTDKIPEDLLAKAEKLCGFLEAMPSEGNIAAIAQALWEERERCALIAEDQTRYFWSVIGRTIAIAIRSPS